MQQGLRSQNKIFRSSTKCREERIFREVLQVSHSNLRRVEARDDERKEARTNSRLPQRDSRFHQIGVIQKLRRRDER